MLNEPLPEPAPHMARLYPETRAGRYSRADGTVEFYQRVRVLARPHMHVMDLGAGRGEFLEDPVPWRRELRRLQGSVARVVGVDIDPAVRANPAMDEAVVVAPDAPLPFARESFDMIVSDYTFEHVEDPIAFAAECERVLKPGGWLCARTPNKWGYIGMGARLAPNKAHTTLLKTLQPDRQAQDIFPVRYRLNSIFALKRAFSPSWWEHCSYIYNPEPAYFGRSVFANATARGVLDRLPHPMGAVLMVFLRKRDR